MKKICFLLLPFLLLVSCEVIEAPYFEESYLNSLPADERCLLDAAEKRANITDVALKKKVLLEEMTGHQCGNCPSASKEAHRLKELFGDDLIFIGIHAGPLANIRPGQPKYATDFRTEAGDEFYGTLNDRNAVPLGLVDRSLIGTSANEWETFVRQRLESPVLAHLQLYTCFNSDSNELGIVVDVNAIKVLDANTRLSVLLIEDEVMDWQKDYSVPSGVSPDIEDYPHSDVLRTAINGTWGELLADSETTEGSLIIKSYALKLNPDWKAENCKIVAYVHNFDSKEVYQVASISLEN